jgi:hypothetical protein
VVTELVEGENVVNRLKAGAVAGWGAAGSLTPGHMHTVCLVHVKLLQ